MSPAACCGCYGALCSILCGSRIQLYVDNSLTALVVKRVTEIVMRALWVVWSIVHAVGIRSLPAFWRDTHVAYVMTSIFAAYRHKIYFYRYTI